MLDGIKAFFNRNIELPESDADREGLTERPQSPDRALEVAACALLLELAHADEEFADEEREHIEEALERHFDLDADTVQELIELADKERRKSVDLYQFTRLIADTYDLGQKMVLVEVMWRVHREFRPWFLAELQRVSDESSAVDLFRPRSPSE